MAAESDDDDRLFVRDGWRHYRRRYSMAEVRWGLATFGVLALVAGWVAWKGAHQDPTLFTDATSLMKPATGTGGVAVPIAVAAGAAAAPTPAPAPADRGPLPRSLAGAGWREDKIAQFDPENLYVKIDGRADYFRAFGFRRLTSVLLVDEQGPTTTITVGACEL